jgi:mannose-6-phosphate isomerase-like protein (cupin superfamily)
MSGEWIEDPVLKLRMRLWDDDNTAVGEVEFAPGGHIGTHLHPRQTECWMVEEGRLEVRLGRRRQTLGPGEDAVVAPGVRHSVRNTGPGLVRARFTATPALDLTPFLTEAAAMNRAGKVTSFGLPRSPAALLEGAEYIERYRETCVLVFPPPFPPPALQPLVFGPLARLARRRREAGGEGATEGAR